MYRCMRCNKVTNDGDSWYVSKEVNQVVLSAVCPSCLKKLVEILNLLFWRKQE